MSKKENKSNAMRILEKNHITFETFTYECDEFIDGLHTAEILGFPKEIMYKTLITVGKSKEHYVFAIPIAEELDMKKAARSVQEKSLEMLPLKDLTKVTGYVRGGCTAIGMKKNFKTVIDNSALNFDEIIISGGRIGLQLKLAPAALAKVANADFINIVK